MTEANPLFETMVAKASEAPTDILRECLLNITPLVAREPQNREYRLSKYALSEAYHRRNERKASAFACRLDEIELAQKPGCGGVVAIRERSGFFWVVAVVTENRVSPVFESRGDAQNWCDEEGFTAHGSNRFGDPERVAELAEMFCADLAGMAA